LGSLDFLELRQTGFLPVAGNQLVNAAQIAFVYLPVQVHRHF
jgi:hypothetical protein